jgi:DNA repair protein RadC
MKDYQNLTIKQWLVEDRPREKLLSKGISSLSDTELLAILISTGTKNFSAIDLARQILQSAGNNLHLLGKQPVNELMKINGIGEAKAITIVAALELGRRRKRIDNERQEFSNSKSVFDLMQPILGDLPHEEFWILYLNRANYLIEKECISIGGTSGTVTDVKIIVKHALEKLAQAAILVHNHPSGNIKPSVNDKNITKKLQQAFVYFDIALIDHMIIGDTKYLSFADESLL